MLEVEVIGAEGVPGAPSQTATETLVTAAFVAAGITGGHVAIEYVAAERIALLNREHRSKEGPTDVLSFPVDGADTGVPPEARELGDVVICPEYTSDLREAIVHGVLHLAGMDHETDDGEMLALQAQVLGR